MTKPRPGTPSMHLLEEAASASKRVLAASSGSAPNALMASISNRRPCFSTSAPISAIGLRMPLVVSQWTANTCVMSVSAFRILSTSARSGGVSSGVSCTAIRAPGDVADPLGALAVGAVDQQQHLARRAARRWSASPRRRRCPSPASARSRACPLAFTTSGRRSSTSLLILRNVASREPQSCTITSLTRLEVVSGPGVRSSGSPVSDDPRTASRLAMQSPLTDRAPTDDPRASRRLNFPRSFIKLLRLTASLVRTRTR